MTSDAPKESSTEYQNHRWSPTNLRPPHRMSQKPPELPTSLPKNETDEPETFPSHTQERLESET